ncbi:hypothetical protein QL919_03040 [Psychrobacter sp. APC 3426]|uniref:hypothetical protein n=1 Tax=Psychrobacter sp. APC 3426 TaxID=3035177 RepID=UPI0025B43DD4|nr:hypothetical protein [Psychrobacter sp. APC 3426]MDN3397701.1 hypothetical protein [Psychrobacter sp. APC 3426]
MASSSLGTLTLDLAIKLSEFSDGLTRAEREARDSTSNISDSVRGMRDSIADDMSKISGSMAGMAIGAVAVAGAAMAAFAIETAKADVQLGIMAGTANSSLKSFQVLTHAAAGFGVEQEALAAILADTQEKLGEFSATGGGGAADFFEALQNNTKMTDEEIRNLGKTLQGKDGVGAIQYLKDEMDALGATSQEQRFIMESLAGDLGNLMPLFANGGLILKEYGTQLEDAGVIKSQAAIDQSRILAAETQAIQTKFEGLKTQLVADMIPALGTLATHFSHSTDKGSDFREEVTDIGKAVNVTAAMIVGLAAGVGIFSSVLQQFSIQAGSLGQTVEDFYNADGFKAKGAALAAGATRQAAAGLAGYMTVTNQYREAVNTINTLMDGQKLRLSDLGQTYYDSNTFLQSYNEGLEVSTQQADENAKAEDKRAKALDKTAKAQERLVGISGDTGIGKAHLHVQYRDKSRPVSAADLGRFQAGGKKIADYPMTSGFGKRNTGIKGASKYHRGTDYDIPKNTAITTTVPVAGVKTWHDAKGGGYVSTITFEDGVVIDLLHQMPGVMGIDKGASSGNKSMDTALAKADAMAQKAATDALRAEQELQRKRMSIVSQYATNKERVELDHKDRVLSIKSAHAEGSADYVKYIAREEERYTKEKNATLLSITEKYFSEEQKIHDDHKKAIAVIEKEFVEGDPNRVLFVDLQNAAYEEDLANFKFASEAKLRQQNKMYQSIADSARANSRMSDSTGLDSVMKRTMDDDQYASWRLSQDYVEDFDSVNNQYSNRKDEINAKDERDEDYLLPELERSELLLLARQEHLDGMWALEQDYTLKQQSLDEQLKDKRILMQETAFGSMTTAAAMFFGENSKMHRAAFALEKAYAVQKALMTVKTTYSNTFDAISAIPVVGPYLAVPAAIAASAMQVAQAAGISSMSAPSVSGIAHGGLDYVPKESTYLLDKGERVLSPNQNSDLTKFMNGGGNNNSNVQVNIINNSSARVQSSADGRTVTITDVRNEVKRGFDELNNPNSHPSKMVNRNVRGGRRRQV